METNAIALNFLKKFDSNDKLIFHESNLKQQSARPIHPPTCINLMQTVERFDS